MIPIWQVDSSLSPEMSASPYTSGMGRIPYPEPTDPIRSFVVDRMNERGLTLIGVSKMIGRNPSYIHQFLFKGSPRELPELNRLRLADVLEVNEAKLRGFDDHGKAAVTKKTGTEQKMHILDSDTVNIPETTSTTVPEIRSIGGARDGGDNAEQEDDATGYGVGNRLVPLNWRTIPQPFLGSGLSVQPRRALVLPMKGDSMAPVIENGELVLIDLDDKNTHQAGLFALLDGISPEPLIYQVDLIREGQGRFRCSYINKRYRPFELPLGPPVEIVGRVFGKTARI